MPDKEQIISRLRVLPTIQMGHVAKDGQIWEGNEMGAHFKVTRETLPLPRNTKGLNALTLYALSVSGLMLGKEKVVDDFIRALGVPIFPPEDLSNPGMSMIAWEASQVDKILKK